MINFTVNLIPETKEGIKLLLSLAKKTYIFRAKRFKESFNAQKSTLNLFNQSFKVDPILKELITNNCFNVYSFIVKDCTLEITGDYEKEKYGSIKTRYVERRTTNRTY